MDLIVQKYGGTSVGSVERIAHVADHIAATVKKGSKVLVVVSAMGEQTDELIALAEKLSPNPPRRELDMLLTAGERISMALTSIALHERQIPSVSLTGSQSGILTDETHGNARIQKILGDRVRDSLGRNNVVIVAGFQGVSPKTKEITTLGRGGSDLSAIALASVLHATRCELYKDVDGVMTADPRLVKSARLLAEVSWDTMSELAWAGASVLHARGAHVAGVGKITLEIRSSFKLEKRGTFVRGVNKMEASVVHAIAHKTNLALVRSKASRTTTGLLQTSLAWLWEQGETPLINQQDVASDGVTLTQVVSAKQLNGYTKVIRKAQATEHVIPHVACITIVGSGFWQSPETVRKVSDLVPDAYLIDVKNSCITVCAPEVSVAAALSRLHKELIELAVP